MTEQRGAAGPAVGTGVPLGGQEIGALDREPFLRLVRVPQGGQRCRGRGVRRGPPDTTGVQQPVGRVSRVQIEVHQPVQGPGAFLLGVLGGGQRAGVLAQQIVEAVAVRAGLLEEVAVQQGLQEPFGLLQWTVHQRRCRMRAEFRPEVQREQPEDGPLCGGQGPIRHLERARYLRGSVAQFAQPSRSPGELIAEGGQRPGRPGVEPVGRQFDGQR